MRQDNVTQRVTDRRVLKTEPQNRKMWRSRDPGWRTVRQEETPGK